VRERLPSWPLADLGFDDLGPGFERSYRRGRKAMRAIEADPSDERFHEWRKRAKYHWYHLRMFTPADPVVLEPWADRLHDLADALGDDHDLAVLVDTIEADPEAHGGADVVDVVRTLAEGRRADLQARAFSLGARYTTEPVDAVVARLATMWEAWHVHGDAPERTELEDLAGDDLDELTVAELRRIAADLGVAGRSRMRRDELAAAVRAAGHA